jgi:hypothetical protein
MLNEIMPSVVIRNVVVLSVVSHLYWCYAIISNVKIPTLTQKTATGGGGNLGGGTLTLALTLVS